MFLEVALLLLAMGFIGAFVVHAALLWLAAIGVGMLAIAGVVHVYCMAAGTHGFFGKRGGL